VILVEKGTFPRQKVCGEFLSPEGADVLRRLGVWALVERHHPRHIAGFTLTACRQVTQQRLPYPGWGVSRWVLDQLLWEEAVHSGVSTRERCTVVQVAGGAPHGFTLTVRPAGMPLTQIEARAVLCAAGRQWQPRRPHQTARHRRERQFVGLKTHVHDVPLGDRVELHTIRHGYCGMVEVTGGETNLCCWTEAAAFRQRGGTPSRFLESVASENARLRHRLQGVGQLRTAWTTTSYTHGRTVTPVVSDVWHIGDCAAMVAPLTGDGMGMGLRAAELAATQLLRTFRQELPWHQATAGFVHGWRVEFLPRLRWGRCLEAFLLRPRLATLACVVLHSIPALMPELYRRTRQCVVATDAAVERP
jgi:flavin-dependent dehydrogenase